MRTGKGAIAVTGATGQQGGAVARRLLREGWHVRALTRRPDSPSAAALAGLGAEVMQADLMDETSLQAACAGASGVFSVQDFWEHGFEAEVCQGKNIADAALAAGVRHFVYASVGGTDRTAGLGIRHFDSKAEIERHLAAIGLPCTVVRPVSFFENFVTPRAIDGIFERGVLQFPFPGERPFQLVAVEDEASFAAAAFADPERFIGLSLELASDICTLKDLAAEIGRVIGRDVVYQEVDLDLLRQFAEGAEKAGAVGQLRIGPSLVPQLAWNRSTPSGGWNADMALVRKYLPETTGMAQWVASVDWRGLRERFAAEDRQAPRKP
ncbi:MAG: NmrA/HSCARG family protein [Parvibaculum sp.]|nr:NmrA/HSCARG family protein [Parvibaculum sp.]